MRVLIVDDEALARRVVREYLGVHADVEIVGECANGFEAVQAIHAHSPELVFLDIQMPKLDGFEVAELTRGKTRYIFATAYDQYALKAFEVHAIDYLLKPFAQARFDEALAHARASLGLPQQEAAIEALLQDAGARKTPVERIVIRDGAKVHVIATEDIDYVEAQDDYILLHAQGKTHLKAQRLAHLEEQLAGGPFLRIHRSWLVNLARLVRIELASKDNYVAILQDGSRIPVSRSGYQKLKAVM